MAIQGNDLVIFGAGGLLGREIAALAPDAICPGHEQIDLLNEEHVVQYLRCVRPHAVINCAAAADVDRCEVRPGWAYAQNDRAVKSLARACEQVDAKLLHISTDYVFDGTGCVPLDESALSNPINCYGSSKLAGERHVLHRGGCVLRLQWLYGSARSGFVDWVRANAAKGPLSVVDDCVGAPTWAVSAARMALGLLHAGATGIYHGACSGNASWLEFAQRICELCGIKTTLQPIFEADLHRAAKRPHYTVFNLQKIGGIVSLDPWEEALERYLYVAK